MDAYVTFNVELDVSDVVADALATELGARRLPSRGESHGRLQWKEVAGKTSDPNDTEMFERALRTLMSRVEPFRQQLRAPGLMSHQPEIDIVIPVTPETDSTEEYFRIPADLMANLVSWEASVEVYVYDLHPGSTSVDRLRGAT